MVVGRLTLASIGAAALTGLCASLTTTPVAAEPPLQQPGTASVVAAFAAPVAVVESETGDLYVAGLSGGAIRIWKRTAGESSFVVVAGSADPTAQETGDGPATSVRMGSVGQLALAADGSLLIADHGENRLRRLSGGTLTTIAGDGGVGSYGGDDVQLTATHLDPVGVAARPDGSVFVASGDDVDGVVLRLDGDGTATTVAGGGTDQTSPSVPALDADLSRLGSLAVTTDALYLTRWNGTGRRVAVLPDGSQLLDTLGATDGPFTVDAAGTVWAVSGNRLNAMDSLGWVQVSSYSDPWAPPSPTTVPLPRLNVVQGVLATGRAGTVLYLDQHAGEIRRLAGPDVWPTGWDPAALGPVQSFPGGRVGVDVHQVDLGPFPSFMVSGDYAPGAVAEVPVVTAPHLSASLQEDLWFDAVAVGPGTITVHVDAAERTPGGGSPWLGDPLTESFTYPDVFPSRPAPVTAVRNGKCVDVEWQAVTAADHYVVAGVKGLSPLVRPSLPGFPLAVTGLTDCQASVTRPYTYSVWAVSADGAWSRPAHATGKVGVAASLAVSSREVVFGRPLRLTATVRGPNGDARADLPVSLQQRVGRSTWHTVDRGHTRADGTESWTVAAARSGRWRVVAPETAQTERAVSQVREVVVDWAVTLSVHRGARNAYTASGWIRPARPFLQVNLFAWNGHRWARLPVAFTGHDGSYRASGRLRPSWQSMRADVSEPVAGFGTGRSRDVPLG